MTVFNGTNGNDVLPPPNRSNKGDDHFLPMLGNDIVDGGTGTDTMTIDYSSDPSSIVIGTIEGTKSFAGSIFSNSGLNSVGFLNIEHLRITSGGGDDTFNISGEALSGNTSISINAGAGYDQLGLDLTSLSSGTNFVASGANVISNRGNYSNFEAYFISTGAGNDTIVTGDGNDGINGGDGNNFLNGGAGDDFILAGRGNDCLIGGSGNDTIAAGSGRNVISGGDGNDTIGLDGIASGIDTIDGGNDFDIWKGDYSASRQGLYFDVPGNGMGTLSNGTTLKNIELFELKSGSGNDRFKTTGGLLTVIDSSTTDFDTVTIDYSARNNSTSAGATLGFDGNLDVSAGEDNYLSQAIFYSIEKANIATGAGNDFCTIGAANVIGKLENVSINAGAGYDTLDVYLQGLVDDVRFVVARNVLKTNFGSYSDFEEFTVNTGSGNDTIVTSGGNDRINAGTGHNIISSGAGLDQINSIGIDKIDGGEGFDFCGLRYYDVSANLALVVSSDGTCVVSNGTTLKNIESIFFDTANGVDAVYASGFGLTASDIVQGDADIFVANLSTITTTLVVECSVSNGEITGSVHTEDRYYSTSCSGYENVTLKTGSGNDFFLLYLSNSNSFAPLTLDGGASVDQLNIDARFLSGNLALTVAGSVASSNFGTFVNFENYIVLAGDGNDVIKTGSGNDGISGGLGNDTLNGGQGNDDFSGGSGSDTFQFTDLNFGGDLIEDFASGEDKLLFSSNVATSFDEFDISGNGTTQVTIAHGADSIVLTGFAPLTVLESDFLFVS